MLAAVLALLLLGTPPTPVPASARQMILVTTPTWSATTGRLVRYARDGGGWRAVGAPTMVNVGRAGLGWGRGLHATSDARAGEPDKREGDGRAPAGVFRLTGAFGYDASAVTGLPYHASTPSSVCVDDSASPFYNRVFDAEATGRAAEWSSRETMRRDDEIYRLGVVVAHNGPTTDPSWAPAAGDAPTPGGGSCIFLHIQRGPGVPTAGCTSMPAPALASALAWLDADADPVLVQLPATSYRRLRAAWGLP